MLILETVNTVLTHKGLLLKEGTVGDATLISAPSSTKNEEGKRDPQTHQTKKGNQWYFGMNAHALVHGEEAGVFADAGYPGVERRENTAAIRARWHIAMRPGLRRKLDKASTQAALQDRLEYVKASIRAKVEHRFRVIKQQFGHVKIRYSGLKKNTTQLHTLFALANHHP